MPEDTRHRRLIYLTGSLNADQANASRIAHSADAMIPKMIGILIAGRASWRTQQPWSKLLLSHL